MMIAIECVKYKHLSHDVFSKEGQEFLDIVFNSVMDLLQVENIPVSKAYVMAKIMCEIDEQRHNSDRIIRISIAESDEEMNKRLRENCAGKDLSFPALYDLLRLQYLNSPNWNIGLVDNAYGRFIKAENFKMTENFSWYDGPISGLCEYNDKQYFYHIHDITDNENFEDNYLREYAVFEITEEQLAFFNDNHLKFKALDNEGRKNWDNKPFSDKQDEVMNNKIIGWYVW